MISVEDLAKKIYRRWYNKDWPPMQSTSEHMALEAAEVSIAALAAALQQPDIRTPK